MLRIIWTTIRVTAFAVALFFVIATAWYELTTSPFGMPPGW